MEENDRLALAEDCAQDALNSVLFHLSDFRGESQFTTWAYKFGINTALSRARRERWKAVSLDELSEDSENADWLQWREELQIGSSETPVRQAEVGQILREVIRSELTEKQRQVLKWIAFDDVPMDVVTERLDTNRNAVYKLLHDSRMKVRRRLAAEGYEVDEVYALFQAAR
jgi:RNA polymerase sigma-70 factor (ECF subfamily)